MIITPDTGTDAVITEADIAAIIADPPPPAPPPVNRFEVRGYELAKLLRDGSWECVGKYRENEIALGQANAACKALNRNPRETYQVRVLVSCELPQHREEPLVLESDQETPAPPDSTPLSDSPNQEINA